MIDLVGFALFGCCVFVVAWLSIAVAEEVEREKARRRVHERVQKEFR